MRECGTCHEACACREAKFREMETMLAKYEEALKEAHSLLITGEAYSVFWREDAIEAINQALDAAGKAEG